MAPEKDLNSPDIDSAAASADATAATEPAATVEPRWIRWVLVTVCLTLGGLVGANIVHSALNFNTLPACDSQRTRSTLSDLNQANRVNASDYNFIKEVSRSDAEVICVANLALRDGSTLEYDYRLYKVGPETQVTIMMTRGTIGNARRSLPVPY
jgi:hypothetical protein